VPTTSFANEYSPASYNGNIGIATNDSLGVYSINKEGGAGIVSVMADNWELVESDVLEVTLYDNYTWSDGEPITTEDWKMKFAAEEMFELPLMTDIIDTFEAVDDHTFRLAMFTDQVNPEVLVPRIMNFRFLMNTPAHTEYGTIIQEWLDASSDSARSSARQRLANLDKRYQDSVHSGPFDVVDASSDRFVAEINEHHPAASEEGHPLTGESLDAARYHLMYLSPDVSKGVAVTSGETVIEWGPSTKEFYENLSDRYRVLELPGFKGHGLFVNLRENEFFAQKEPRQAIQYAIDTQTLADNIGPKKHPVKLPHGLKTNVAGDATDFASENVVNAMNDYNWNENDFESAAEKLREAGASKQGGEWIRPNGEQISFQIEVPPWDGYAISHETVSQTLNEFGFNVSQLNVEAQVWSSKLETHDFSAFNWFWGGQPTNANTLQHLMRGTMPEGGSPVPITAEIPWPPGEPDAKDQEINGAELFNTYRSGTGEESQAAFDGLVWFVNQAMPMNPYTERIKRIILDTQKVNWPPEGAVESGHPRFYNLVYAWGWPQLSQ
jgi:peptide/nickel transport system substrate-binding protein